MKNIKKTLLILDSIKKDIKKLTGIDIPDIPNFENTPSGLLKKITYEKNILETTLKEKLSNIDKEILKDDYMLLDEIYILSKEENYYE